MGKKSRPCGGQEPPRDTADAPANDAPGLARRDFLRAGALSVAGSLAAVAGRAHAQPAAETKTGPEPGQPRSAPADSCVEYIKPNTPPVTPVSAGAAETWNEPWVWRPSDWPGQQLDLNIVENQNPGIAVGLGNPGSVLFSYGGQTPGPTIRMKGDETLYVKLRNLLGMDFSHTTVGPYPKVSDAPTPDIQKAAVETVDGENKSVRYEVYTVLAKPADVHADTPQYGAQNKILGRNPGAPAPGDVIIAWVLVERDDSRDPCPGYDLDVVMKALEEKLPPVQEYLKPVHSNELHVTDAEVKARKNDRVPLNPGDYRTRRVVYSGWGHPSMPLLSTYPDDPSSEAFRNFVNQDGGKLENLIYAKFPVSSSAHSSESQLSHYVMLAPDIRTMAIGDNNPRTAEEAAKAAHRTNSFKHSGLRQYSSSESFPVRRGRRKPIRRRSTTRSTALSRLQRRF